MQNTIYLLDIEGTTTPISFVYDVLFPYARSAMRSYVADTWGSADLMVDIVGLQGVLSKLDDAPVFDCETPTGVSDAFLFLMDGDIKAGPLKSIQGRIWRSGYLSGELVAVLFDDVPSAIKRWSQRSKVFIYSSGSIAAQKLLFGFSNHGDLQPMLSGYFDTTSGPKKEAASYHVIAETIGCDPALVLFASDNLLEVDAARAAGMKTVVLDRPGNHPIATHDHAVVTNFDDL